MLDDERIEAGIVVGEGGFLILGERGSREEAEADNKKNRERADHKLGLGCGFPAKIEHGKDTCDHE